MHNAGLMETQHYRISSTYVGVFQVLVAAAGFCPFEVVFAIKASGAGPLAKGDLYANDQMGAASLLSSSSS